MTGKQRPEELGGVRRKPSYSDQHLILPHLWASAYTLPMEVDNFPVTEKADVTIGRTIKSKRWSQAWRCTPPQHVGRPSLVYKGSPGQQATQTDPVLGRGGSK